MNKDHDRGKACSAHDCIIMQCDECVKACIATHNDGATRLIRDGLRFENYLVATSCHPELTGDRRVHAMFVDVVRRHLAERAGAGDERGTS